MFVAAVREGNLGSVLENRLSIALVNQDRTGGFFLAPLLHHVQLPSLSDQVVGGKIVKKRPQNARSTIYLQATITPAAARNPFSHARESGRPSSQNLFLPADSQRRAQEEVRELV